MFISLGLLGASLVLRTKVISDSRIATQYVIATVPLVHWSTVANIEIKELFL